METLYKTKKPFRTALWAGLVLAVAALWFWGARPTDTYTETVYGGEYGIEGYGDGQLADYTAFSGQQVAEFERETLVPGTYTLTVTYKTEAEGGRFEVVDPETGAVLAQGAYDPGQGSVSVTFERKNGQYSIAVRSRQGADRLQIDRYELASQGPVYTDSFWILGLLALLALFGRWCLRRRRAGQLRDLQLLLLGCVFSLPYLSDHLQYGHDIAFHVGRIFGIGTALRSGQFPVRLNADLYSAMGGYANPVMYPELFLYFSGAMCALGASALLAAKVLLILINFLTAYCGYYGAKQIVGDEAGMAFTLLYLCCPYRLDNIFIRAALGEALAMAFLPLAAAGIFQLMQGDCKKGFWAAVLGITGVLQSHILTMFLLVLFGALYGAAVLLWQGRRFWAGWRRPLTLLAAAAATLALNVWFLVPFLQFSARYDFNAFHITGWLKEFKVYPWQMFMESYSTGGALGGTQSQEQLPVSLGSALLLGAVLMVWRWLRAPRSDQKETTQEKCLLGLGTAVLAMASMAFPWEQLEKLPLIQKTFDKLQFPWRLLAVAAVLYCLAAAVEVCLLHKEQKPVPAGILIAMALLSAVNTNSQYFYANKMFLADKAADRPRINAGVDEYLPAGTALAPAEAAAQGVVPFTAGAQAGDFRRDVCDLSFTFANDTTEPALFRVPQYDYGLHRATLADGQALALGTDPATGFIVVAVPAGIRSGTVLVYYREPLRFKLATGVSLLTAAALALLWRRRYRPGKSSAAPLDRRAVT